MVAFSVLVAWTSAALALDEFSSQNFRPPIDPFGYVTVEGGKALAPGQVFGAVYYDWAHRPLIGENGPAVHWLDLVAGYGIASVHQGGLEAGLDLPIAVDEFFFDPPGENANTWGLGDLRADAKLDLFDRDDDFFGLALRGFGSFPTGWRRLRFLSNDGAFTAGGDVVVEGKIDFIRGGVNLGAEWIDSRYDAPGLRVDDRLRAGFGFALAPLRDIAGLETLELVFEATHWTLLDRPWRRERESPVEVGGAVRYNGRFFALAGASGRLAAGAGAPDARVEVALGFSF